jgi:hypothetical protein
MSESLIEKIESLGERVAELERFVGKTIPQKTPPKISAPIKPEVRRPCTNCDASGKITKIKRVRGYTQTRPNGRRIRYSSYLRHYNIQCQVCHGTGRL